MNTYRFRFTIFLLLVSFLLALSGCTLITYLTCSPTTDSADNEYNVLNKNYFRFDIYDTLEVIVSDNERFVLYDHVKDQAEEGIGEWIKDGNSLPVRFYNDNGTAYNIHGDIIIYPNADACRYLGLDVSHQLTPFVAKIKNDSEQICLYWWESGNYPYNDQYGDKVSVKYRTYQRSELDQWAYIPEKAYSFYSGLDQETAVFSCTEASFSFSGFSCLGTWTINGEEIPVKAVFDKENFSFYLLFNTADDRNGEIIFEGAGESITETEAIYTIMICPNFYDENSTIKLIKQ